MTIWVDAHLPSAIATWMTDTLGVTAVALRDIGLRDAEDPEIFEAAKAQGVILMTKDSDFVDLVDRLDSPPQIIWLTCGNTSNARLRGCIWRKPNMFVGAKHDRSEYKIITNKLYAVML